MSIINCFDRNITIKTERFLIKLASEEKEYEKLYKLRYHDLILDYNKEIDNESLIDKDEYDEYCDHLIAIDLESDEVVGTYRLIRKNHLVKLKRFLTEDEFNIDNLKKFELLELGRAVVKEEYRNGAVINLLWKGLMRYAIYNKIEYIVGTASFHGIDPTLYLDTFKYLEVNRCLSEEIDCFVNQDSCFFVSKDYELDEKKALENMPPLIKGYLRLGSYFAKGAYIDKSFNSIDLLAVLKLDELNPRYMKRYLQD